MKRKISVSIEEKTITDLENHLKDGRFRNKSHIIEFAVNKLLKESEK